MFFAIGGDERLPLTRRLYGGPYNKLLSVTGTGIVKLIICYQLIWLVAVCFVGSLELREQLPSWLAPFSLGIHCALMGSVGGTTYCLRAVYLNRAVRGSWNDDWAVWYYVRPLVSTIAGAVSYVALSAGLLVLEASYGPESRPYGFLALAFVAGLNVDRFLAKVEGAAETTWGIRKSRASEQSEE
jgi:hypothetical protein